MSKILRILGEYLGNMSFDIRIDGIDNAMEELEKLQKSLGLEDLSFWCKRISNDVKLKAPKGLGESFVLEVEPDERQNPKFILSYLPELTEIVVEVIRSYMIEMPVMTHRLFEEIIKKIEQSKGEQKA